MAAVSQQKPPQVSTTVTRNDKVVSTYSQPIGDFAANDVQMKLALAAAQAQTEGKDAVAEAKKVYDEHEKNRKDFMDTRRYMIAAANKARGHFEDLPMDQLWDVMAITETPPVSLDAFKKSIAELGM